MNSKVKGIDTKKCLYISIIYISMIIISFDLSV